MPHKGTSMKTLAIVQCGGSKIWKKQPRAGKVPAKEAYISGYFRKNRAYAEKFADRWYILSAKYGFLEPNALIRNYNVSFKEPRTGPISAGNLRKGARAKGLHRYNRVIVLGGVLYADKVEEVFQGTGCKVHRPFDGLKGIRYIQQAVSRALKRGKPLKTDR